MKSTDQFKQVIEARLQEMAAQDPLFAASLQKEGKNIENCITYILNAVQKSGCNAFSDDEVFGMAAHYYDEDNIDIGKPIDCKVVINRSIELTPDEMAQAKKEAMERAIEQEREKLTKKATHRKESPAPATIQQSLF